jgi:hypothetical protein
MTNASDASSDDGQIIQPNVAGPATFGHSFQSDFAASTEILLNRIDTFSIK